MSGRDWRIVAMLALAVVVIFADVLFFGAGFFFRDLFVYHYPMKKLVRDAFVSGEFPFWTRYFGGGQPVAANPAWEIFYPPQWLIFAGSYHFGFGLHILFHILIALGGMYVLLREIPLGRSAAVFGAISFGLGGFLLGTVTNMPTFFVWSWAPLVSWACLRLHRAPSMRRFAAAAIVAAMPVLVGDPTFLLQMSALLAVMAFALNRTRRERLRSLLLLMLLGIATAAVAAVQLVPAVDHVMDSGRSRGFDYDFAVAHSMPPVRPIELFIPRFFGVVSPEITFWGSRMFNTAPYLLSIYAGLAVTICAIAGFVRRLPGSLLTGLIVAAAYILGIGQSTPLYRWLFEAGLLRSIRYPEKFAATAVFALIVFAAIVADRIVRGDTRLLAAARVVAVISAVAAAAMAALTLSPAAFAAFYRAPSLLADVARMPLMAGFVVALGWCVVFLTHGRMETRIWTAAALLMLLVDVVRVGRSLTPTMPRAFFTTPPIARLLASDRSTFNLYNRANWATVDPNRQKAHSLSRPFAARNAMSGLTPAAWGFRTVMQADFDQTQLKPTEDFLEAMEAAARSGRRGWSEPFMAVSNVRYVLDYRDFETDMREAGGDLYRSRPLVARQRPNRGQYYFMNDEGRVLSARETANTAAIDVVANTPALLFTAVTRHKYWRATVDGVRVEPVATNIAYQAIPVPAGRHRVAMRYFNPLVVISGAVSLAALLVLALMTLRRPRLRPRSES